MFKFWNKKETDKSVKTLAKEELEKNREVFESLRDYDKGEKEISTTNIKKHMRDLQRSS